MMAESILDLEFEHMGLLYMNIYVRSVINLCETVSLAVPPISKAAGMDHPIDAATMQFCIWGFAHTKAILVST